eukprot:m.25593 g.25593  ORF g.25593 m.25593 type:complete len:490 (-) comp7719_c0_seq1:1991-3460(-)
MEDSQEHTLVESTVTTTPTGDILIVQANNEEDDETNEVTSPLLIGDEEPNVVKESADAAGLNSASIFSSCVNLTNTIIGAGMLGLPYAFSKAGPALGGFMIFFSAACSSISLHLLAECQDKVGIRPSSFYVVANASIPLFTSLIDMAVMIKSFGVGTSYLIVIGDLMPDVMAAVGINSARNLWVLIGFAVVVPLSYLKTLDALRFTSALSLFFVFVISIFVFLYSLDIPGLDACPLTNSTDELTLNKYGPLQSGNESSAVCKGKTDYFVTDIMQTFNVLTIFFFAFACQQNMFGICDELKDSTPKRVWKVILPSIGFSGTVYLIVAIGGFVTFGDAVKPDILVNYPANALASVARTGISILVAFSYPLQVFPARKCAFSLYSSTTLFGLLPLPKEGRSTTNMHHYAFTTLFLGASLGTAMSVTNLGTVLALVGATGSIMVAYILPGAIYFRLHSEWTLRKKLALMLVIVGCCVAPVAIVIILIGSGASH